MGDGLGHIIRSCEASATNAGSGDGGGSLFPKRYELALFLENHARQQVSKTFDYVHEMSQLEMDTGLETFFKYCEGFDDGLLDLNDEIVHEYKSGISDPTRHVAKMERRNRHNLRKKKSG